MKKSLMYRTPPQVIKSKEMKWAENVTHAEEQGNAFSILYT
jgi:hypothetical protein